MYPQARTDGLVTQRLPDEVLVYDANTKRAHCLNHVSAVVWQQCDGRTSVTDIAAELHAKTGAPADEKLVWLALSELQQARLLEPNTFDRSLAPGFNRREVMKRAGLAVLLPVVLSVAAPTAARASSGGRANSDGGDGNRGGLGRNDEHGNGNNGDNGNHGDGNNGNHGNGNHGNGNNGNAGGKH